MPKNDALRKRAERDNQWQARYEYLTKQHKEFSALLNLLAHFMFYSGVGIKTAQGMGMIRVV
jgi:CRISPR/Cas system endoribonuclease Cas6 (RAMP superfamily)